MTGYCRDRTGHLCNDPAQMTQLVSSPPRPMPGPGRTPSQLCTTVPPARNFAMLSSRRRHTHNFDEMPLLGIPEEDSKQGRANRRRNLILFGFLGVTVCLILMLHVLVSSHRSAGQNSLQADPANETFENKDLKSGLDQSIRQQRIEAGVKLERSTTANVSNFVYFPQSAKSPLDGQGLIPTLAD